MATLRAIIGSERYILLVTDLNYFLKDIWQTNVPQHAVENLSNHGVVY